MSVPLLRVEDLVVQRGKTRVLELPELEVRQGEALVLIGPNGAGKSTCLLSLARLIRPSSGRLYFRGEEITQRDELAFRRRLALVLQEPLLLDSSVEDNVSAGMRFRGLPAAEIRQRSAEWLRRLGVLSLAKRRARSLSGGEAQRVSLARAFCLQSDLLLLDEPFSALDAPTRAALLSEFQTLLAETGQTCVFVTHDLDEALTLGHRLGLIMGGQLRQIGAPEQVFSAPADEAVAAFVGVETILPGLVETCTDGVVQVRMDGQTLEVVGQAAPGRQALVCLRPEDVTVWRQADIPVSSARNRLNGVIRSVQPQGALVRVVVDCGRPVTALVTRSSARELELSPGQPVSVSFKASAAHLICR